MGQNHLHGILFDLDGVLYNSNRVIEGAVSAIQWVQTSGIPHLFVTNTTSRSRLALADKLSSFGFSVSEDTILTPAVAAAEWLRQSRAKDLALFVRSSTRDEFAGFSCIPDDAERGASYVIVGDLGEEWDYRTLNRAFRLLHYNPDTLLMALGMTRYWQTEDGISLDVAPFVAALEHATGRQAEVFGKPSARFFETAVQRLGLPSKQILMFGDDIVTDIAGAQSAGLRAALVRTGKFRSIDMDGAIKPDYVLDSVASLPKFWEEFISSSDN